MAPFSDLKDIRNAARRVIDFEREALAVLV